MRAGIAMRKRAELFHVLLVVVLLGYVLYHKSMVNTTPTDISVRSTSQNERTLETAEKATSQDELYEP